MDKSNIYCVGMGEILFDVLPTGAKLGGAPANFAYHVGQHGLRSVAVSALGEDELGSEAVRLMSEKELPFVTPLVDYPTGTVQVTVDSQGVPAYDIRTDVAWDHIPFTHSVRDVAEYASAVCWGTLAQRSDESRKTILDFVDHTPASCLKIFDINLRQHFYTKEVIHESLQRCNMLKINDEELEVLGRLFGCPELDLEGKCMLLLGKYDLDMLVLTCGANGSYVFAPGNKSFLETPQVGVADTVGAGDSFTGTFCAGILMGLPIAEAHKRAVEVSAYVCTQQGAMPRIPASLSLASR